MLILNKNIYFSNPYLVNINMRKILVILILSFVQTMYSQQTNIYHVVSSGETLSKVAQKYKITPYDIIKLNPNAVNGIKEKEVLIIPKTMADSNNLPVQNVSNIPLEKKQDDLIHVVQPKETKFGISKLYGITVQQLEEKNPNIVAGLQVGQKLKINGATTSFIQDLSKVTATTDFDSKFEYVVLPGETLYGISKRNELTVGELTKFNTTVLNGVLKSGQRLTIPTRKGFVANASSLVIASSNSKHHLVEAKETKFGLSKRYGITIEQLENLNPQIVKGLQIGQKITIPSFYTGKEDIAEVIVSKEVEEKALVVKVVDSKVDVKSSKSNFNGEYVNYQVQPKETLFGLSKKAGMSVSEFTVLNPKLVDAVQIGMIVKMPKSANVVASTVVIAEKAKITTKEPVIQKIVETVNNYQDLTSTLDKSVKKQVAIVMPFDEVKYKEYLSDSSDFKKVKDEFVRYNLEFYSGALKAIDSLKSLDLNVDVKLTELQNSSDETVVKNIIEGDDLSKSNAVFMPFYNEKAMQTASSLSSKNVPVITSQFVSNENGISNLYVGITSEFEIRLQMLNYLKSKNANIIVVNSTNRVDSKNSILQIFPDAKFVKVSDRNVVDADGLRPMLVKNKLNYVVLDTDKSGMIISATNVLLNESIDYQIQIVVLEPSLLSNYETVSSIRINILKMMYPSYSSLGQSLKLDKFNEKNLVQGSQNFLLGFDLTFDTLLRLYQNKGFENSIKEDVTERLKYKFQYINKSGYNSNNGFYILQHDTDNIVKVLN